jgi:hypothetical protein
MILPTPTALVGAESPGLRLLGVGSTVVEVETCDGLCHDVVFSFDVDVEPEKIITGGSKGHVVKCWQYFGCT